MLIRLSFLLVAMLSSTAVADDNMEEFAQDYTGERHRYCRGVEAKAAKFLGAKYEGDNFNNLKSEQESLVDKALVDMVSKVDTDKDKIRTLLEMLDDLSVICMEHNTDPEKFSAVIKDYNPTIDD